MCVYLCVFVYICVYLCVVCVCLCIFCIFVYICMCVFVCICVYCVLLCILCIFVYFWCVYICVYLFRFVPPIDLIPTYYLPTSSLIDCRYSLSNMKVRVCATQGCVCVCVFLHVGGCRLGEDEPSVQLTVNVTHMLLTCYSSC